MFRYVLLSILFSNGIGVGSDSTNQVAMESQSVCEGCGSVSFTLYRFLDSPIPISILKRNVVIINLFHRRIDIGISWRDVIGVAFLIQIIDGIGNDFVAGAADLVFV